MASRAPPSLPFLNGLRLMATQADASLTMLAVAAGDPDESTLAPWLREHTSPR